MNGFGFGFAVGMLAGLYGGVCFTIYLLMQVMGARDMYPRLTIWKATFLWPFYKPETLLPDRSGPSRGQS